MDLQTFLPYRLAVLSETVSQCIAAVYRERFDLTRDEWRVLATLAEGGTMRTVDVIASTTLEKMQASRALTRLQEAGYVERLPDPADGRGWLNRLRPQGRALWQKIVPMVQARESFLLEALEPADRARFVQAIGQLEARARQLSRQG